MNAIVEIGILVFRESLECILVLAAVTAGLREHEKKYSALRTLDVPYWPA